MKNYIKSLPYGNYMATVEKDNGFEFICLEIGVEIFAISPVLEFSKVELQENSLSIFVPVMTELFTSFGKIEIPYHCITAIKTIDEIKKEDQEGHLQ